MKRTLIFVLLLLGSIPSLAAADLAQSNDRQIVVWFYDATTGAPKTGITVTSETCRYVKSDMTTASFSPTASGGTNDQVEIGNGAYRQEITATQLDTLGIWEFNCSISGSVSPPTAYQVLASSSPVFTGSYASITDVLGTAVPGAFAAGTLGYTVGNAMTMNTIVEGTMTLNHWFQYGGSALFGKYTQSPAGTFSFRDIFDTKNRVVYVTTSTSRSSVTLSPD